MPVQLSSKDNSLFKQVVKNYESKQYKKGLRAAEQILKKNPNHGDTQAMKALILNSQGHSEKAFALAKEALKNDMKSHICWHVYGLLYRSVKNYEEAIRAYNVALKLEPESLQIQRDLALLQVQMRDFPGYQQSRLRMLKQRSTSRQNWTALAVAHHLGGDYEAAERFLTTYEGTLKSPPSKADIEHSEASIYKNTIIAESGDIQRALEHLDTIFDDNLDRTAVMELRASYLLKLDRKQEAETAYRELLDRNNEYRTYFEGLEQAIGLDQAQNSSKERLQIYQDYAGKGFRADAPRRIPLDFLEGDEFKSAATDYLRNKLERGVPSTFANIKALYRDPFKSATIRDIVEGFLTTKTPNGDSKGEHDTTSDEFHESVSFFLAQHYNYYITRDLEKATSFLDNALKMKPKSVDYNMTKGRILKHQGKISEAADAMEHARSLDEKDRYINTKCAKYQLRADRNEDGLKTMSKFTRNETVGGPLGDLHDMQCMWFITEDGEAYLRKGRLGLALKRFHAIYNIFDVWQEDQFDFHSFSLRKGQIRAYIDMFRWEDRLREHPFYSRAAIKAIKIYLRLHDNPDSATLANGVVENFNNLSLGDRKKALKKAKKDQEKREKAEAERREVEKKALAKKAATKVADEDQKKEDPDPDGKELIETKEPLEAAIKFLIPMLELNPENIEAQNVGYEVYIRKKKYLLALRCLLAASAADLENPTLHYQTIHFQQALDSLQEPLSPKVSEVIKATFNLIPTGTSLTDFNSQFLSRHGESDSVQHVLAGVRARRLIKPDSQPQGEKDVLATLDLKTANEDDVEDAVELLKEWNAEDAVKQYRELAKKKWPDASRLQDQGAVA